MFENLGWPEIAVLLLIALFVIGPERLPKVLQQVGKGIRKVRNMASEATADISKEVGTTIDITDLHPKTFIRKHVLSEADEEALKSPLKSALSDIQKHTKPVQDELNETARSVRSTGRKSSGAAKSTGTTKSANGSGDSGSDAKTDAGPTREFDPDAT